MKNNKFIVEKSTILFDFLREKLMSKSKNNVKSLLSKKHVFVNDRNQTKYDYKLKKGDVVTIKTISFNDRESNHNIEIIYEDDDIIVINKPAGILSISNEREKTFTAYHMVMNYLKEKNKNNKVFVIHRLDKETSGVLMFAKNNNIKNVYQESWNDIVINRKYYAIIEGKLDNKKGIIKSYLKENNSFKVYSSNDRKNGKLAITEYELLKYKNDYSLLDINIKTGRKNQIRVHLSDLKRPILGDKKYGSKVNPIKRLALHAYELDIVNPKTKQVQKFRVKMPKEFKKIV